MKKARLAVLLTALLCSQLLIAATIKVIVSPPVEERIIQVPLASDKNNDLIKQALTAYAGVSYLGMCTDQKLYFIRIDRSQQADDHFIDDVFHSLSLGYFLKSGTTEQALSNCENKVDFKTTIEAK